MKENQIYRDKEFNPFCVWEDARVWTETIPLIRTSAIWGQYCLFFTSWTSLGLTAESGCILMAARWQVFFSFPSSLRAQLTLEGCNWWWLWYPCLLIWQEIFHFSDGSQEGSINKIFICSGKPTNLSNLLYCDICFIVMVWNANYSYLRGVPEWMWSYSE